MKLCRRQVPSVGSFSRQNGHVVNHDVFTRFPFTKMGKGYNFGKQRNPHRLLVIWVKMLENLIVKGKVK